MASAIKNIKIMSDLIKTKSQIESNVMNLIEKFFYIASIILIIFSLYRWYTPYKIWRWKTRLRLNQHLKALNLVGQNINGFCLSKQARLQSDALEYVYGEINLVSFAALLSLTRPCQDSVFYDLGSGIGKTVLLCAMLFPIKKSCGIELLTPLHQAALLQHQRLSENENYRKNLQHVTYLQGNFLDIDLNDATIIYINATAYFGETWVMLNHKLDQLHQCCTIVTTTKQLTTSAYQLTRITQVQMSWGIVKAFIYTRRLSYS